MSASWIQGHTCKYEFPVGFTATESPSTLALPQLAQHMRTQPHMHAALQHQLKHSLVQISHLWAPIKASYIQSPCVHKINSKVSRIYFNTGFSTDKDLGCRKADSTPHECIQELLKVLHNSDVESGALCRPTRPLVVFVPGHTRQISSASSLFSFPRVRYE